MILKEIALSGWRCFADEIAVGPFEEGLNVLYAPNGSGKSTLFEALRLAVFDSYRVGGQEIESIRPWGRDLSPRVRLVFEMEGETYELSKRYLKDSDAQLRRMEGGRFEALAEGKDADERLREIFSGSAPGRGLSRPAHWGLAQILWAPQGQLQLEVLSDDVTHNIQALLGNEIHAGKTGKLERRIDNLYNEYFTATGNLRSGKKGAPLKSLEEEQAEILKALLEAREALQQYETSAETIKDLESRFAVYERQIQELNQQINARQESAKQYGALQQEAEKHRNAGALAEADFRQYDQALKDLLSYQDQWAKLRAEAETLEAQKDEAQKLLKEREATFGNAEKHLTKLRQEESDIAQAKRKAEQARQFHDNRDKLEQCRAQLEKVRQVQETLEAARKERAALVAPTEKELKALRTALQTQAQRQTQLDALLISLEVTPLEGFRFTPIQGEPEDARDLAPGESAMIRGEQQVALRLGDFAEIRASGPVVDTASLREELAQLALEIETLTRPYGEASLDALESLHRRARSLDEDIRQAETRMEDLLGSDTPEGLAQEAARAEAECRQLLETWPDWEGGPPEVDALARAAEAAKEAHAARKVEAEAALELARNARDSAREQAQELRLQLDANRSQAAEVQERIQNQERKGNTVEALKDRCNDAAMRRQAALGELEKREMALSEYDGNPAEDLQALERQREDVKTEAAENRDKLHQEKGRMTQLADARVYSRLVELEERLSALDEEIVRETRKMKAIKLLKTTKDQISGEVMASVVRPVSQAATRMLERVAGSRLGAVAFDDSFVPTGVYPRIFGQDGNEAAVDLDNLSGGEQEQLHFVTRLALAETLAREQRQMVVMDDVLTATDAGRLGRIFSLIEEAAERLQIILLTCHPERYRGLANSRFLDLESLRG